MLTDILGDQLLLSSTSTYYPPITIINDLLIDSEEKRNSYTFEHWNYWSSPASPASIYQYSRSILRRNSRKKKKRKTRSRICNPVILGLAYNQVVYHVEGGIFSLLEMSASCLAARIQFSAFPSIRFPRSFFFFLPVARDVESCLFHPGGSRKCRKPRHFVSG